MQRKEKNRIERHPLIFTINLDKYHIKRRYKRWIVTIVFGLHE